MQKNNFIPATAAEVLFHSLNFIANVFAGAVVMFLFILLLAQTSFAPLNLKLLADYTFEAVISAAQPVKGLFPAPKPVITEYEFTEAQDAGY